MIEGRAPDPSALPIQDLHEAVALGLERGESLLTDEERAVAQALLAVDGPPGIALARLSSRVRDVGTVASLAGDGVPDPAQAADALAALGLLRAGASWPDRIAASTRATLAQWCALCGLPAGGRRADLVERLADAAPSDLDEPWFSWPHRRLLLRLERFATLRKEPDRGLRVAERLGHLAWPDYGLTDGTPLFADRGALLAWEALYDDLAAERLDVAAALAALRDGTGEAPGRLSLRRRLIRAVREAAERLGRARDHQAAASIYAALEEAAGLEPGRLAVPLSRQIELGGDPILALDLLAARAIDAEPASRLGIDRAGRRIARASRRSWAPGRPLRAAPTREVALAPADGQDGPRPRWRAEGTDQLIEGAIIATLAAAGRIALRCEGGLARTLFSLIFADALFAPVPGALPVPRLEGPLDYGGAAFAARRPREIQRALDALGRGHGPAMVQAGCARFVGRRVAGVVLPLEPSEPLVEAARALGGSGLRALLVPLLATGVKASAGLPDLLVLPGPAVELSRSFPSRLSEGLLFVEVKGPTDSLRDGQRVWHDRLLTAGFGVEVWRVRPEPSHPVASDGPPG